MDEKQQGAILPKFESCDWSVEVVLTSSSASSSLMKPLVKLTMHLKQPQNSHTEAEPVAIVMDLEKFGELRMKTAQALKNMGEVERNKVLQQGKN